MGWTDGSVKHHPNLSEVIVDPKTVPESRELQWLEKLGISAWPEGYTLLIRITRPGGKIRYDQYIYGHPAGKFRSIREFTPHLDFLANPSEKCHCCLCGRLSQPTTLVPATPIQWISKSTDGDSAAETPPPGNTARKNCSLRDPNRSPRISKANVTHLDKPSDQLTYWRWQDGYRPGEIVWVLFKVIDEKRRSWWPAQVTSRVELPQTENDCARTETLSMDSSNEEVTSQSSNTRSGPPGLSLRTDTVTSEGIKRTAESLTDEDLPFVKRNQNDLTTRLWRSSLPLERNGEKEAGRSKGFVQENSPGLPFSSRSSAMKVAGYNNPETFAYYELRMLPLRDRPMPFAELSEAPVDVLVPSSEIKPFLNHIVAPRANDSVKWHKAVIQAIGLSTTCGPLESTIPERKPGLVPNPSQFCRDVEDLKQSSYTKCIDRFRLGTEEIRLTDLVRLPVVEDRRFEFAGLPQIVRDIHKRYLAGRTPPLYMEVLGIEYRGPSPAIFVTGRLYRQILIQDTEGRSRRGNFAVAFDPITDLPDMSANSSHTGFARPLITSVDTAAPDVNVNSDIVPPDSTIKVTMNALELAGRAYPNFMDLKSDRMPVVECTHKLG